MLLLIRLVVPLLPIILFLALCLKKATKELWVFFIYILSSFLFDILNSSSLGVKYSFILWDIFYLFQLLILSLYFYVLIKNTAVRYLLLIVSILYTFFYFLSEKSTTQYFSYYGVTGLIILLVYALFYMAYSLKPNLKSTRIITPTFLISLGIVFVVSSTLFLQIISNGLTAEQMQTYYWPLSYYVDIIINILYSIVFIMFRYTSIPAKPGAQKTVDFTFPDDR